MEKKKIMVVEDDKLLRIIYQSLLVKQYEVILCANSKDFYSKIANDTYDLFIMDLGLNSEKDGIDLIHEIRSIKNYQNTPIIVITAYASMIDEKSAMDAGATKFIRKPFTNQNLLAGIQKILNQ